MSQCEKIEELLKKDHLHSLRLARGAVERFRDEANEAIKQTGICASYRDRYRSERNTCREKLSKYEPSAAPKNIVYGAPEEYNYKKNKSAWSAWETPSMVPELSASGSTLRNITNVKEPSTAPPTPKTLVMERSFSNPASNKTYYRGGRKSRRSRNNRRNRKNRSRRGRRT
jgi:hypothetical protein